MIRAGSFISALLVIWLCTMHYPSDCVRDKNDANFKNATVSQSSTTFICRDGEVDITVQAATSWKKALKHPYNDGDFVMWERVKSMMPYSRSKDDFYISECRELN